MAEGLAVSKAQSGYLILYPLGVLTVHIRSGVDL